MRAPVCGSIPIHMESTGTLFDSVTLCLCQCVWPAYVFMSVCGLQRCVTFNTFDNKLVQWDYSSQYFNTSPTIPCSQRQEV